MRRPAAPDSVRPWLGRALDRFVRAAPLGVTLGVASAWVPGAADAQGMLVEPQVPSVDQITELFPASVPGFDQERGLQLPSLGTTNNGTGVHAGSFWIRPVVSEGIAYDTNTLAAAGGPASSYERTSASVAANSDWSRNRLGAFLGVANSTYFDTPRQSRTDWKAAIGGGYTIGRGEATLAYSHLSLHEDPTSLLGVSFSTPLPFQADDVRADYTVRVGSLGITPYIDYTSLHYGTAILPGQAIDEAYQDHDVLQGGVAVRYGVDERRSLLFTAEGIGTSFPNPLPAPGLPAPNATSAVGLAGFDWEVSGAIALRVLLGVEAREFQSRTYTNRTEPIGQVVVTWRPTLLTTVTGTLARSLEDAVQADVVGFIYSRAEGRVSHELRRDVTLQGRVGVQIAQYLQVQQTQTDTYVGATVMWQLNRQVQVSADNTFDGVTGALSTAFGGPSVGRTGGHYTRDVARLQVAFAL